MRQRFAPLFMPNVPNSQHRHRYKFVPCYLWAPQWDEPQELVQNAEEIKEKMDNYIRDTRRTNALRANLQEDVTSGGGWDSKKERSLGGRSLRSFGK